MSFKKTTSLHKHKKPSSQRWILRHLNDPFVHKARTEGYRCRSAFKIEEIHKKYGIIRAGMTVLDLGCAPGGWAQWVILHFAPHITVWGVDLLRVEPLPGLHFIQGDMTTPETQAQITPPHFDLIMSDMAPSFTGHSGTDRLQMEALLDEVWDFTADRLVPGGHFVAKVFHGDMLAQAQGSFHKVNYMKPHSSRAESREIYLIGRNFRKQI